MATKTKNWSTGSGSVTIQYGGQGDGEIIITSDPNSVYEARSMQITVETTNGSPKQTKTITINQAAKQRIDLSTAVVTAATQTYSGSAKTPSPTVTLNGSTVPSSGYNVAYSNNTNAGTATITVTGKGDYTGTAYGTFTINKASRNIYWSSYPSSLRVGESDTLSAYVSAGSGDGSISYSSSNSSRARVSGSTVTAVSQGTCTIYASISEGTNYLSASTSYTLTVAKAIPAGYVDMGLPSGLLWAEMNIGAPSIYSYECEFFSYGNVDGHAPTGYGQFSPWTWGLANNQEPYVSSAGAALTGNIPLSQDAARQNLGSPSRMPTIDEYDELFSYIRYIDAYGNTISSTNKLTTVNGTVGIYLESIINGERLFFPCCGYGGGQTWGNIGTGGNYRSSTLANSGAGYLIAFGSSGVFLQEAYDRFYGFSVRAVIDG